MPEIFLPLSAVEEMCKDAFMPYLMSTNQPRDFLGTLVSALKEDAPDWVLAGLSCTNDADVLPVCIHVYLMDWKPKEAE